MHDQIAFVLPLNWYFLIDLMKPFVILDIRRCRTLDIIYYMIFN